MDNIPSLADIQRAHMRMTGVAKITPIHSSRLMNERAGTSLFFKCENFQTVGAFKIRGATNAVFSIPKDQLIKGVCTHSSGNHAQAIAKAASVKGVPAYIVMPSNAPKVKKEAVLGYGATVIECVPKLEAREEGIEKVIHNTGATFIHPFNNLDVIAGQATAAMEFISEMPKLDFIVTPVGGGGLISGTALSAHYLSPGTRVIGAEPINADDAARSLKEGRILPSNNPKTIADGLLSSLGSYTFNIISNYVEDILTVSEDDIIQALKLVWTRMKLIIEPSSAVAVAAVLANKELFSGKKVGIILSGGNVDPFHLPFT